MLGAKTKNTVYSSFLSLTVEKTISYFYLLSLLVPIISYYSFWGGALFTGGSGYVLAVRASESSEFVPPGLLLDPSTATMARPGWTGSAL